LLPIKSAPLEDVYDLRLERRARSVITPLPH
jgi:hypothetical protein